MPSLIELDDREDMHIENLKRFLDAGTTFSFGDRVTPHTANDFWRWAFSNMNVPVLRGVLIEYLVAQKLIAHCDDIVGDTVRALTTYTPGPGDLTRSIEKHYQVQPHGDVFDLQLSWGVTLEIKSTASPANWRLNKTCRWNIIEDKNLKETVFPAQFYILAQMGPQVSFSDSALDLGAITFHVRTGEELERLAAGQQSLGFARFVGDESARPGCGYDQLPAVLLDLQTQRLQRVRKKLRPDWKLVPRDGQDDFMPLAVERDGKVEAWWYWQVEVEGKWTAVPIEPIESPWLPDETPGWRDWEAAGFAYVPEVVAMAEPEEAIVGP
ncbi:hypothetical protein PII47_03470 [Pseudomonas sp. 21TX0197]|uniref:hypothetical protein n=1 Tax=unclassified Pseudomonas TaxID=196821 RepID=UPI0011601878|nr:MULTISPECIES: hypothetical protein [unclassified Pseudomonas]MDB6442423.1 hypothetical protein [Pseudomonas sp. 21TX0197]